jgi:hypothetical protein
MADDAARQVAGAWKLVSWLVKFDGGDAVETLWTPSQGPAGAHP